MSKLYRARSLLYRRQILQENIRWKALDEIYKIYMLLPRSDLNIFQKLFVKLFRIFQKKNGKILQNLLFLNSFIDYCSDFADICEFVRTVFQSREVAASFPLARKVWP